MAMDTVLSPPPIQGLGLEFDPKGRVSAQEHGLLRDGLLRDGLLALELLVVASCHEGEAIRTRARALVCPGRQDVVLTRNAYPRHIPQALRTRPNAWLIATLATEAGEPSKAFPLVLTISDGGTGGGCP